MSTLTRSHQLLSKVVGVYALELLSSMWRIRFIFGANDPRVVNIERPE